MFPQELDTTIMGLNTQHGRRRHTAPHKTGMYDGASHLTLEEKSKHSSLLRTIL
jgi:hypothetical protein